MSVAVLQPLQHDFRTVSFDFIECNLELKCALYPELGSRVYIERELSLSNAPCHRPKNEIVLVEINDRLKYVAFVGLIHKRESILFRRCVVIYLRKLWLAWVPDG